MSRLSSYAALLATTAALALGATAPAYAEKPASPPGHADAAHASAPGQVARTTSTPSAPDTDQPQPRSTADDNGTGANQPGPYDSTRDGSASANGSGTGKATGRPCAGCVGKADNKNPKGQLPDARHDGNRGYECDDNHGIGRGNPAHTTCRPPTGSTPEVPVTPPTTVTTVSPPEQAGPPVTETLPPTATVVEAPSVTSPAAAVLPQTGSPADAAWLAALGLALLVGGTTVTLRVRRRA